MRHKLKPLSEQTILITGASSGIGLVTARAAAKAGARVMFVARDAASLGKIVEDMEASGNAAAFSVADVGSIAEVREAASHAIRLWGRIDTWVNCAGVTIYAKLVDTPLDEHEAMFRTNYFGVVNGSTVAVELMRQTGGALITVGSIAGDIPAPIMGAYSASKHAVKGYIESLRLELDADEVPISVTLIKPSGIDTPIAQHAANHVPGEGRVPPVVYAPELVAKAVLDAAQTARREMTVGGVGRAQVLFGLHFPALFEKLSRFTVPLLIDRGRTRTAGNAISSAVGGRERSGVEIAKAFSLYTSAVRHPGVALLGAAAILGLARALILLRRR